MSVSIAHIWLDSSDQSIAYQTDDAEEEAETHGSRGEEESGEDDSHGRGEIDGGRTATARRRALHHSLSYISTLLWIPCRFGSAAATNVTYCPY